MALINRSGEPPSSILFLQINIRSRVSIGYTPLGLPNLKSPAPSCQPNTAWCMFWQALSTDTIYIVNLSHQGHMLTLSVYLSLYSISALLTLLSSLSLSLPLTQCLLSLSVGPSGQVYSFEMVHKHLAQAKKNYHNWCCSWDCHHPDNPWPNNVQFIEANVSSAQDYIDNPVDAVSKN